MADDGFFDDLVKAGLIIGSIWLGVEFLKKLSKKCWRCGNLMTPNQQVCNVCSQNGQ